MGPQIGPPKWTQNRDPNGPQTLVGDQIDTHLGSLVSAHFLGSYLGTILDSIRGPILGPILGFGEPSNSTVRSKDTFSKAWRNSRDPRPSHGWSLDLFLKFSLSFSQILQMLVSRHSVVKLPG